VRPQDGHLIRPGGCISPDFGSPVSTSTGIDAADGRNTLVPSALACV